MKAKASKEEEAIESEAARAQQEATAVAESIAEGVKEAVAKRHALKSAIDWKGTDPAEREALLAQLKDCDADIQARLAAEASKQQTSLADRLAKRKGRKAALAREECDLKIL